jgi:DNA-binding NarL/FixJ family response regulator
MLTPRQWQIVELVAEGMRNREIGQRLGLTETSIKNYLRKIYDTTGMSTRVELALWHIAKKGTHETGFISNLDAGVCC